MTLGKGTEEGGESLKRVQEKIFAAGGSNATLATVQYSMVLSGLITIP